MFLQVKQLLDELEHRNTPTEGDGARPLYRTIINAQTGKRRCVSPDNLLRRHGKQDAQEDASNGFTRGSSQSHNDIAVRVEALQSNNGNDNNTGTKSNGRNEVSAIFLSQTPINSEANGSRGGKSDGDIGGAGGEKTANIDIPALSPSPTSTARSPRGSMDDFEMLCSSTSPTLQAPPSASSSPSKGNNPLGFSGLLLDGGLESENTRRIRSEQDDTSRTRDQQ